MEAQPPPPAFEHMILEQSFEYAVLESTYENAAATFEDTILDCPFALECVISEIMLLGVCKTFIIATFLCGMFFMVVFKVFGFLELLDEFSMSEKLIFGAMSLYVCFTKTDFTGMEPYIFAVIKCFMTFCFVLFIVSLCTRGRCSTSSSAVSSVSVITR